MAECSLVTVPQDIEERFDTAVKWVQSLPKDGPIQPSNERKLVFYGLYKRITAGENGTTAPSYFNMVARAKWEAWKRAGELSRDRAMQMYTTELCRMVEEQPDRTQEVDNLLTKLKGGRGVGETGEGEGEGKEVFWDANNEGEGVGGQSEDNFHHIQAPSLSQVQSDSMPSSENHASDTSSSSDARPRPHTDLRDLTQLITTLSRIERQLTAIVNTLNMLQTSVSRLFRTGRFSGVFSLPSLLFSFLLIWPFLVFYLIRSWIRYFKR